MKIKFKISTALNGYFCDFIFYLKKIKNFLVLVKKKKYGMQGVNGYKSAICSYWARGSCKNGPKCSYAHGRDDMQVSGEK